MNTVDYRIGGIYDYLSFQNLKNLGIKHFSFDFRPLSLNFLQRDEFLGFIKRGFNSSHKYYLQFEFERKFILDGFFEEITKLGLGSGFENNFFFEFSGGQNELLFETVEYPYLLHLGPNFDVSNLEKLPFLKGVVIPFNIMEGFKTDKSKSEFKMKLNTLVQQLGQSKSIDIALDWSNLTFIEELPSVPRYFLSMHRALEKCYRQVDQELLKTEVELLKVKTSRIASNENTSNQR